ncbi:WG repeat-containing protein [Sporomusa acidovorans]|uniref:KWG leptospira n=1 Tax=Sporomusa acidovorans (strain ATCC 49682 / DSM 3132 / Mol) TaxID=1123286 RepID=A0ABZ3IXA2_SPOA4|nr:WG repeat-containing protein [Sporomusa acidovorans]OZC23306.1 hypothetical protein SPACI_07180 [Sporomusa acidovorans DSM 3132]SDE41333.1 WG containing repeat-containing protein [Sporomusa acidovorans]
MKFWGKVRALSGVIVFIAVLCGNAAFASEPAVTTESASGIAAVPQPEIISKVKKAGKYGCINRDNKVIVPIEFNKLELNNGIIYAKQNGKYGLLDQSGKNITPLIFDEIQQFPGDLAAVKLNSKWGLYNKQGNVVLPVEFDTVNDGYNGLIIAKKDNVLKN